jgi:hypothetical protein
MVWGAFMAVGASQEAAMITHGDQISQVQCKMPLSTFFLSSISLASKRSLINTLDLAGNLSRSF